MSSVEHSGFYDNLFIIIIIIIIIIIPENRIWHFMQKRQFAWNVKTLF